MNTTQENEAGAVAKIIGLPAGYCVATSGLSVMKSDLHGGRFLVQRMEDNGDEYYDSVECTFEKTFTDYQALQAAQCFVEKRHELRLGDDYEAIDKKDEPEPEKLSTPLEEMKSSFAGCSGSMAPFDLSPRRVASCA
jgi:hypothetical protein